MAAIFVPFLALVSPQDNSCHKLGLRGSLALAPMLIWLTISMFLFYCVREIAVEESWHVDFEPGSRYGTGCSLVYFLGAISTLIAVVAQQCS